MSIQVLTYCIREQTNDFLNKFRMHRQKKNIMHKKSSMCDSNVWTHMSAQYSFNWNIHHLSDKTNCINNQTVGVRLKP